MAITTRFTIGTNGEGGSFTITEDSVDIFRVEYDAITHLVTASERNTSTNVTSKQYSTLVRDMADWISLVRSRLPTKNKPSTSYKTEVEITIGSILETNIKHTINGVLFQVTTEGDIFTIYPRPSVVMQWGDWIKVTEAHSMVLETVRSLHS